MHREPLPHDIIRVPGSSAPERVVSVDDHTLTLAPLRSDDARTIERPAREHIALVGVAAPGRKRRADTPLQSGGPTGAASPVVCDVATEMEQYLARLAAVDAIGGDITKVTYGSGGVDPSDLF